MSTQYILRRLLLFTLTYFAKCQLFSTFLLSNIILFPNEPLLFTVPIYLKFSEFITQSKNIKELPFSLVFKKFQVSSYVPKKSWWVSIFIVLTGVIVMADDMMPFLFPKTQWSSSWKWIWKWPEIIHHQKCPLLNGPMWEQFLIEDLYSSCCYTLLENFSKNLILFLKKNNQANF